MHLRADNTCAIYEVRPAVCRITSGFADTAALCNKWQAEDGMADWFRVNLDEND